MNIRPYKETWPVIAGSARVDQQATVIGDVRLDEDSSVWPQAVLRGDVNSIHVGARSNIQDGTVVHVSHRHAGNPEGHATIIGDDVTVGHNVTLHGCRIGNQCLIGIGATVLDGVVIHDQVLLGAGSLVTPGRELYSGFLYMGQPARKVRALTEEELKWFAYSAQHYVRLKNDYSGPAIK